MASAAAAAVEDAIQSVNEAYRVLSDPGRRALYDRSLRGVATAAAMTGDDDRFDDAIDEAIDRVPQVLAPARFPWRGFAVATVLAAIAVGGASLLSRPSPPPAPDGILEPQSCVTIEPNGDAREAACASSGNIRVRKVVPFGFECPFGTRPHRDHQGQGIACLDFSERDAEASP